ncbi:MAG TPA: ATP-dependent DNA ligase [Acidimicrobiales bacterium]|nr:ATP-dependent DNA ligase [Acidimicrobiales bacterium]
MPVADLPVAPPVSPMLAKLERQLPVGDYIYEPKWDGFRCIVFRDGAEVELGSRNELPLTRYFPEVVEAVRRALPERVVLDGEVVVAGPSGLDFELLSQRVHPAESRVRMLASTTPASLVAFDLLALGDEDLRARPFAERRHLLEEVLNPASGPATVLVPGSEAAPSQVRVTPATRDAREAGVWFERFEGAGLDGVVAKLAGQPYVEGKRVMVKVKHERTAEFVVAGFRWYRPSAAKGKLAASSSTEVGSLLLGLYDEGGNLAHVGVIGAFPVEQRRELVGVLEPYRAEPGRGLEEHPWAEWAGAPPEGARWPGARSRWNANKDLSFEALRPELVVEAAYEHLQGRRLRHTAQFRRWRPDRTASSCTYAQLDAVVPFLLADVFGAGVVGRAGTATAPTG